MNSHDYARVENGVVVGEAILYMKSRPPNADGTIGFTAFPGTAEGDAWLAYFLGCGMDGRASAMRARAARGYMVPCAYPADFDPNIDAVRKAYRERVARREIDPDEWFPKPERLMTSEDRQQIVNRALKRASDPERLRRLARQKWEGDMLRIEPYEVRGLLIDIIAGAQELAEEATEAELKKHGMGWGTIRQRVLRMAMAQPQRQEAAE